MCNLRKFKIFGGLNTEYMTELLTGYVFTFIKLDGYDLLVSLL